MPLIIDASTTLAWCFESEATMGTQQLWVRANVEGILVPCIWPLEIANALLISERRRRIDADTSDQFAFILDRVRLTIDQPEPVHIWSEVMRVARDTGLTTYDASYLELAMRTGHELATRDARLFSAAAARGVRLITV
jgi:predicted nucleic acid-binding protein